MRVEFLRDWKWFRKGQVIELTKGRGDLLCKRKLCQPARAPRAKPAAKVQQSAPKAPELVATDEAPKRRRKSAIPKPQAAD